MQVVVARFAQVRMVSSPRSLEITPEHVRLGYVDVPAGTVFSVRCNSSRGVTLQVQVDPQLVEGGTITGAGVPVALVGGTAVLLLPGPHPHDSRFELRWRLRLAPEARAGTYPWPVQVQMQGA